MYRVIAISVLVVVGCIIASIAGSTCSDGSESPTNHAAGSLPEVSVLLLEPKTKITTTGLRDDLSAAVIKGHGDLLEPHILAVHLPDGKLITLPVRSSSISSYPWIGTSPKIVSSVYARRPMQTGRFQEVVADMLGAIRQMGYEPNEIMKQMATWGDLPGNDDHKTGPVEQNAGGVTLSGTIKLTVRVKPDPERGWYYLMTFEPISADIIESAATSGGISAMATTQPSSKE